MTYRISMIVSLFIIGLKGKPQCPPVPPLAMGVCAELCTGDSDCLAPKLCCSNGCGHQCMDPVKTAPSNCKMQPCPAFIRPCNEGEELVIPRRKPVDGKCCPFCRECPGDNACVDKNGKCSTLVDFTENPCRYSDPCPAGEYCDIDRCGGLSAICKTIVPAQCQLTPCYKTGPVSSLGTCTPCAEVTCTKPECAEGEEIGNSCGPCCPVCQPVCPETKQWVQCAGCGGTCSEPNPLCIHIICQPGCICSPETPILSSKTGKCITNKECFCKRNRDCADGFKCAINPRCRVDQPLCRQNKVCLKRGRRCQNGNDCDEGEECIDRGAITNICIEYQY